MISSVLDIIRDSLEEALKYRFPDISVKINRLTNPDGTPTTSLESNEVIITLVHITEEHVVSHGRTSDLSQPYYLNLLVLFTTYASNQKLKESYFQSIQYLDNVLGFFQQNTSFNTHSHLLPMHIDHIEFRLANEELRDMSYVWSMAGAKQAPSVLYLVRNAVVAANI